MPQKPLRAPWEANFPTVAIHVPKSEVSTHPWLAGARSGDVDAAALLVADTCAGAAVDWLAELGRGSDPILAAVLAQNADGLNVLAEVLAHGLHLLLGWEVDAELVQANAADRAYLARPALFAGAVQPGRAYVLVDDCIGRGVTLAMLRDHIVAGGGRVLGATALAGDQTFPASATPGSPDHLGSRRLAVRDEPGLSVGAFVVALAPPEAGSDNGAFSAAHVERLRAAKRVIGERARAILMPRTAMPPPQHGFGTVP
ncbi:MAG TPA: hypothetical protein VF861_13670 [Telluria sp.]